MTAQEYLPLSIVLIVVAFGGCNKRSGSSASARKLPTVGIASIDAPAIAVVKVESGDTLYQIAKTAYHHEGFSEVVRRFNGIVKVETLTVGKQIHTPSLPIVFRDSGINSDYQPAINLLAKAWQDAVQVLPEFIEARRLSSVEDGGSFVVPSGVRTQLLQCVDNIEAALLVLSHPLVGHRVPRRAIAHFRGTSASIRALAAGEVGSLDYDVFQMGQSAAFGFSFALVWTQEGHQ